MLVARALRQHLLLARRPLYQLQACRLCWAGAHRLLFGAPLQVW